MDIEYVDMLKGQNLSSIEVANSLKILKKVSLIKCAKAKRYWNPTIVILFLKVVFVS